MSRLLGYAKKTLNVAGELGWIDPVNLSGTIPSSGENSPSAGTGFDLKYGDRSDDGYVTLWSYTVTSGQKLSLDQINLTVNPPSGLWAVPGPARVRIGTYRVEVNATTVMEGELQHHDHFSSALMSSQIGTSGPFTCIRASKTLTAWGMQLDNGDTLEVLFTPTAAISSGITGICPSVVRSFLFLRDNDTMQVHAVEGRYYPVDDSANQVAFSYELPANGGAGYQFQSLMVRADVGKNVPINDVILRINQRPVLDLGHVIFHVGVSTPAIYNLPFGGVPLAPDTIIDLIGRPFLDLGVSVNGSVLGSLSAASPFPGVGTSVLVRGPR